MRPLQITADLRHVILTHNTIT